PAKVAKQQSPKSKNCKLISARWWLTGVSCPKRCWICCPKGGSIYIFHCYRLIVAPRRCSGQSSIKNLPPGPPSSSWKPDSIPARYSPHCRGLWDQKKPLERCSRILRSLAGGYCRRHCLISLPGPLKPPHNKGKQAGRPKSPAATSKSMRTSLLMQFWG